MSGVEVDVGTFIVPVYPCPICVPSWLNVHGTSVETWFELQVTLMLSPRATELDAVESVADGIAKVGAGGSGGFDEEPVKILISGPSKLPSIESQLLPPDFESLLFTAEGPESG